MIYTPFVNFLQSNEFSSGFYAFLFIEESFKLGSHLALNSDFSLAMDFSRQMRTFFIIFHRSLSFIIAHF